MPVMQVSYSKSWYLKISEREHPGQEQPTPRHRVGDWWQPGWAKENTWTLELRDAKVQSTVSLKRYQRLSEPQSACPSGEDTIHPTLMIKWSRICTILKDGSCVSLAQSPWSPVSRDSRSRVPLKVTTHLGVSSSRAGLYLPVPNSAP